MIDELKQNLASNQDYQALVRSGVIPNDLRWDPKVIKTIRHWNEGNQTVVEVTLDCFNYAGGPCSCKNSRRIKLPGLCDENTIEAQLPNDDWESSSVAKFECQQIEKILGRL